MERNRGAGTEREGRGRREGVGRGTERLRNSNSKSLFYKDCSLGSVKIPSNI